MRIYGIERLIMLERKRYDLMCMIHMRKHEQHDCIVNRLRKCILQYTSPWRFGAAVGVDILILRSV